MNKKLKLNKLTVSNLDRVKGGITNPQCACPRTNYEQGAYNQAPTQYTCTTCLATYCTCVSVCTCDSMCTCGPEC